MLKAGILDSMEFVELISEFSKETGNSVETFLNEMVICVFQLTGLLANSKNIFLLETVYYNDIIICY